VVELGQGGKEGGEEITSLKIREGGQRASRHQGKKGTATSKLEASKNQGRLGGRKLVLCNA